LIIQPPNLSGTPYINDHTCENCRFFYIKDTKFHCARYDVNVPSRAICDEYEFAGPPRKEKPVPESLVSAWPLLYEYMDRPPRKRAKTGLEKWMDP
jgi:hypothetical protein